MFSTVDDFEPLVAFQFSLRQACIRAAWCYTCRTIAPGTPRCAPQAAAAIMINEADIDRICLRFQRLQVNEHVLQPKRTMSERNTQVHRYIDASHTVEMVSAAEFRSMG